MLENNELQNRIRDLEDEVELIENLSYVNNNNDTMLK